MNGRKFWRTALLIVGGTLIALTWSWGQTPGGRQTHETRQDRSAPLTIELTANRKETGSTPDFSKYNRPIYDLRIGFGWTPGDVPLRVW